MINSVTLQGRLCGDPELRQTDSGVSTCRFQIASERNYKDKNGSKLTDFLNIVAWRQTADFISHWFKKGDMIMVRGRLESRSYEKDGQKRTAYEVNVDEASFAANARQVPTEPVGEQPAIKVVAEPDDGFPF